MCFAAVASTPQKKRVLLRSATTFRCCVTASLRHCVSLLLTLFAAAELEKHVLRSCCIDTSEKTCATTFRCCVTASLRSAAANFVRCCQSLKNMCFAAAAASVPQKKRVLLRTSFRGLPLPLHFAKDTYFHAVAESGKHALLRFAAVRA